MGIAGPARPVNVRRHDPRLWHPCSVSDHKQVMCPAEDLWRHGGSRSQATFPGSVPVNDGNPIELQTVDVGGVPAFWVPSDGRMSVALLFGVGVRDETLVMRGINHLVEHLTLFGLDHRTLDSNGHVSPTATAFTASGTVSEVQVVLDHVGASLRRLPHDRLEQERRVLRTEARSRGRSLSGLHLEYRFGPNGIGLLDAE